MNLVHEEPLQGFLVSVSRLYGKGVQAVVQLCRVVDLKDFLGAADDLGEIQRDCLDPLYLRSLDFLKGLPARLLKSQPLWVVLVRQLDQRPQAHVAGTPCLAHQAAPPGRTRVLVGLPVVLVRRIGCTPTRPQAQPQVRGQHLRNHGADLPPLILTATPQVRQNLQAVMHDLSKLILSPT